MQWIAWKGAIFTHDLARSGQTRKSFALMTRFACQLTEDSRCVCNAVQLGALESPHHANSATRACESSRAASQRTIAFSEDPRNQRCSNEFPCR